MTLAMPVRSLDPVVGLRGATWLVPLSPVALTGVRVRLEPIITESSEALLEELSALLPDEAIWRYLVSDVRTTESARAYTAGLVADWVSGSSLSFVVRLIDPCDSASRRVVGVTRLKNADRRHRRFRVGSWFIPAVWGSGVDADSKGVILARAFDYLGALRVELETDSRNARSRASRNALGATEEGLLRAHQITPKGERRDTVIYSVISDDWPGVRARIAGGHELRCTAQPNQRLQWSGARGSGVDVAGKLT
jgi:RimJ/RimL family protein N-acetyltransferase